MAFLHSSSGDPGTRGDTKGDTKARQGAPIAREIQVEQFGVCDFAWTIISTDTASGKVSVRHGRRGFKSERMAREAAEAVLRGCSQAPAARRRS
ncbi:hypothetical protein [Bordetella sp. 2513F-2]